MFHPFHTHRGAAEHITAVVTLCHHMRHVINLWNNSTEDCAYPLQTSIFS